ncbi:collagen alpha-1(III) chain-like [Dasypus novemcinctus]|uniref:collagen alpha-1(III) chain-like n=1 Tax=Dasypus novemcinctus TaxID=9361 RepID=UPI00265E3455|nr:collagen alpha-1(III) chain-like [Dasypus novemcinctus]
MRGERRCHGKGDVRWDSGPTQAPSVGLVAAMRGEAQPPAQATPGPAASRTSDGSRHRHRQAGSAHTTWEGGTKTPARAGARTPTHPGRGSAGVDVGEEGAIPKTASGANLLGARGVRGTVPGTEDSAANVPPGVRGEEGGLGFRPEHVGTEATSAAAGTAQGTHPPGAGPGDRALTAVAQRGRSSTSGSHAALSCREEGSQLPAEQRPSGPQAAQGTASRAERAGSTAVCSASEPGPTRVLLYEVRPRRPGSARGSLPPAQPPPTGARLWGRASLFGSQGQPRGQGPQPPLKDSTRTPPSPCFPEPHAPDVAPPRSVNTPLSSRLGPARLRRAWPCSSQQRADGEPAGYVSRRQPGGSKGTHSRGSARCRQIPCERGVAGASPTSRTPPGSGTRAPPRATVAPPSVQEHEAYKGDRAALLWTAFLPATPGTCAAPTRAETPSTGEDAAAHAPTEAADEHIHGAAHVRANTARRVELPGCRSKRRPHLPLLPAHGPGGGKWGAATERGRGFHREWTWAPPTERGPRLPGADVGAADRAWAAASGSGRGRRRPGVGRGFRERTWAPPTGRGPRLPGADVVAADRAWAAASGSGRGRRRPSVGAASTESGRGHGLPNVGTADQVWAAASGSGRGHRRPSVGHSFRERTWAPPTECGPQLPQREDVGTVYQTWAPPTERGPRLPRADVGTADRAWAAASGSGRGHRRPSVGRGFREQTWALPLGTLKPPAYWRETRPAGRTAQVDALQALGSRQPVCLRRRVFWAPEDAWRCAVQGAPLQWRDGPSPSPGGLHAPARLPGGGVHGSYPPKSEGSCSRPRLRRPLRCPEAPPPTRHRRPRLVWRHAGGPTEPAGSAAWEGVGGGLPWGGEGLREPGCASGGPRPRCPDGPEGSRPKTGPLLPGGWGWPGAPAGTERTGGLASGQGVQRERLRGPHRSPGPRPGHTATPQRFSFTANGRRTARRAEPALLALSASILGPVPKWPGKKEQHGAPSPLAGTYSGDRRELYTKHHGHRRAA